MTNKDNNGPTNTPIEGGVLPADLVVRAGDSPDAPEAVIPLNGRKIPVRVGDVSISPSAADPDVLVIGEGPRAANARAAAARRDAIEAEISALDSDLLSDLDKASDPAARDELLLARVRRLELLIARNYNLDPVTLQPPSKKPAK
ncbi:MAG TPA: hypothetical protein PLK80_07330 [bacterium]|nr:MAG: hypothetical protein BWY28_00271 [bacterium ADurb.Bin236]HOY64266.1 hypothetical protein [bacterium]HPI76532.1 hypothetical protein [bacterium]